MTRRARPLTAVMTALLAAATGCAHRPPPLVPASSPAPLRLRGEVRLSPAAPGLPAVPRLPAPGPESGAVAVARAFTAAVCPYSYRDPVAYGQRLDAALARWGSAGFAQARQWTPAHTAAAARALLADRAEQSCGQVSGGLDPEADPGSGAVTVRLSVQVSAHGQDSALWSAQQVFRYLLVRRAGRWAIADGQW